MPVSSKRLATFLLLASALIWGSSFILIKKGLLVFNATQVGLLRITFAMLALLPLALYSFKQYYRGRLLKLTVAGISGNLLPALLFATAQTHLDSGVTGVLNALTPLFTMLVGVILFNYRFIPRQLLGLIIGLTGATLISFIGKSGSWESFNYYSLLVLAASFLYGFMGLGSTFLGFIILAYLSVLWLQGHGIGQRPLFILGVLLLIVGVQFFSIGLLGEMLNNTRSQSIEYSIKNKLD